jgi:5'-3' exonuclease
VAYRVQRASVTELMLLDAPSMYFRAFFGVPDSFRSSDGRPVNAIRGFLDFVSHLVRLRRPTHLVACLDADWRPAFRVAAIPSYKTHRVAPEGGEEVPDLLSPQVPVLLEVLDALGIAHLEIAGFEADDVIGTLATRATCQVDVVTGDRDLFQLVDDRRRVRVLYIAKGVRNLEIYDEASVSAKYGIPGRAYGAFAVLRGDPSDGLPGVVGIGDKTAAGLITAHGDLAGVASAATDPNSAMAPGIRRKILGAADYLAVAPRVVAVVTDLAVPAIAARLPAGPRDPERLLALSDRWNLAGPLNRLLGVMAENAG